MAGRDHARIFTAIWDDRDWRKLSVAAQHAYQMLVSNKDISYCGVLDYVPTRWEDYSADLTEAKLKAAVRSLERAKYVVVDRKSGELLVRSFIRRDGVLARRNMGNACAKALSKVHSTLIREAVLHELGRLWNEDPAREGWAGFKDYDGEAFGMACDMASAMACEDGWGVAQ